MEKLSLRRSSLHPSFPNSKITLSLASILWDAKANVNLDGKNRFPQGGDFFIDKR